MFGSVANVSNMDSVRNSICHFAGHEKDCYIFVGDAFVENVKMWAAVVVMLKSVSQVFGMQMVHSGKLQIAMENGPGM